MDTECECGAELEYCDCDQELCPNCLAECPCGAACCPQCTYECPKCLADLCSFCDHQCLSLNQAMP